MSRNEPDLAILGSELTAASRWNRGVRIRFVLAVTSIVVFAILGSPQTH